MGTVRFLFGFIFLAALAMLTSCQKQTVLSENTEVDLAKVIQVVENAPVGWTPQEEVKNFNKENLFDLMDGQSDAFFVYGFQKAAVQRFKHPSGATLVVSMFQVDGPDSAYGLFSVNRDPQKIGVGNEGSLSPGRRLSFWQNRYFIQMTALKQVPEADLKAAGEALAAALPKGGEKPALLNRLPGEGLAVDPPPIFFHQELTIQDRVWLGGENKLGLGPDTDGVLARYKLAGQPAELVMIEYPAAAQAEQGLKSLQSAGQEDLLASGLKGQRLIAVFGKGDPAAAKNLITLASR